MVDYRGSGNYFSDVEKEIAKLKKERCKEDVFEILKMLSKVLLI